MRGLTYPDTQRVLPRNLRFRTELAAYRGPRRAKRGGILLESPARAEAAKRPRAPPQGAARARVRQATRAGPPPDQPSPSAPLAPTNTVVLTCLHTLLHLGRRRLGHNRARRARLGEQSAQPIRAGSICSACASRRSGNVLSSAVEGGALP